MQYMSKESTREETEEELYKIKAALKLKNYLLKKEVQQSKEETATRTLRHYQDEIYHLSQQNKILREKHSAIIQKEKSN